MSQHRRVLSGILHPSELAMLRETFEYIAAEPWFTRSRIRRGQFAAFIVETYRRGLTEPTQLKVFCGVAALDYYAVGRLSPSVDRIRRPSSTGIDFDQNMQAIARSRELLEKTAVLTRPYVPRL